MECPWKQCFMEYDLPEQPSGPAFVRLHFYGTSRDQFFNSGVFKLPVALARWLRWELAKNFDLDYLEIQNDRRTRKED
jgi:hypothetical protein